VNIPKNKSFIYLIFVQSTVKSAYSEQDTALSIFKKNVVSI